MALTQIDDRTASDTQRAWTIGGSLLLLAVVVTASLRPPALGLAAGGVLASLLFSASLLIFAFGIRGSGSVTARRPLGTTALAALAIWTLLVPIIFDLTATNDYPSGFMLGLGNVAPYIQFALALIAAVQIARAGVVPRPWNWVPSWALAAVVVTALLAQVIFVIASTNAPFMTSTLLMLGGLARFGSLLLLGVVAIVLGDRAGRSRAAAAPAHTTPR